MSTCPEICPDCGENVQNWDSNKTYTCCECVKLNNKVYRVKKSITTTTQNPEDVGSTDWIEIVTEIVPLASDNPNKEKPVASFKIDTLGIFFIIVILLFIIGLVIYFIFFRVSPEVTSRANKFIEFKENIDNIYNTYAGYLIELAESKANSEIYLKQPYIEYIRTFSP